MLTLLIVLDLLILFGIGATVEYEADFLSIVGTVAAIAIAVTAFGMPFAWLATNWPLVIYGFVGWFVVGTLVVLVKWWFFVNSSKMKVAVEIAYRQYKEYNADGPWESYHRNPLLLSENKARIFRWMIWWPSTLLWLISYRLIEKMARSIYEWISRLLQSIANKMSNDVVANVENELKAKNTGKVKF